MKLPHTITLYNRVKDVDGTESYIRSKISGVLYSTKIVAEIDNGVTVNKAVLKIVIPKSNTLREKYVTPKEYSKMSTASRVDLFTLEKNTLVFKGDIQVTETDIATIKQKYEVYTIYGVDDFDITSLAHWNVYAS